MLQFMPQLKLTQENLFGIGFHKCHHTGDELNKPRITFEISTINGAFVYNPDETELVWYHRTVIGENSNWVHLDIYSLPELLIVLDAFQVKYNLLIL